MLPESFADILRLEGFEPIGEMHYRINISTWWHRGTDKLMQILIVGIGPSALIKADKTYYLQSIGAEGQTWARDIGPLHDYLEAHFPELRIAFSHFRDVPPDLAGQEVRRQMAHDGPEQPLPSLEALAELQRQIQVKKCDVLSIDTLMSLSQARTDLLSGYMREQSHLRQQEIVQLSEQIDRQRNRLELFRHLQRQYREKGSAAIYSFTISSNLQVASNPQEFRDALRAVMREIIDLHRYQVTQKLQGGRLNIHVAEATEPAFAWMEQWFGSLSPTQMQRLPAAFDALRHAANGHTVVTPDEPIITDDHVRRAPEHLGARVLSTVLQRIDTTSDRDAAHLEDEKISPEMMPLRLGHRIDNSGKTIGPAIFPLTQFGHTLITGMTGAGKSFACRTVIEEAAQYEKLSILIIDPRGQSSGILVPEDRDSILKNYPEFGMEARSARGFPFDYYAPTISAAKTLPTDLSKLATSRSIVSFKGIDDQQRCTLASRILNQCFTACSDRESETPRLLIALDEAHLLTRRHVDESGRDAAAETERAIEKLAREGRKFGILLLLVTQAVKSFGYELATIRQMISTRLFLRNSGADVEYAADIIGDGKLLVQLRSGEGILHNATWSAVCLRFRPPKSKVVELGEPDITRLLGGASPKSLSSDAKRLLQRIREHHQQASMPLNISEAGALAGTTSKRKLLELLGELEQAHFIHTRTLPQRGKPRVIEIVKDAETI